MLTVLADDRKLPLYMIQNHKTMLKEKSSTKESPSDANLKFIRPMNLGGAGWKQCGNV